jgi:hypothetical protein
MQLEEIEVIIEKDGRVRLQVRGVKGEACLDLTQALEQALGGQIEERRMTSEAYETPPDVQQPLQHKRSQSS